MTWISEIIPARPRHLTYRSPEAEALISSITLPAGRGIRRDNALLYRVRVLVELIFDGAGLELRVEAGESEGIFQLQRLRRGNAREETTGRSKYG